MVATSHQPMADSDSDFEYQEVAVRIHHEFACGPFDSQLTPMANPGCTNRWTPTATAMATKTCPKPSKPCDHLGRLALVAGLPRERRKAL